MPIRPDLRHLYRTPEYKAARAPVIERAQNRCEQCGAPNGKEVLRQYGWWTEATLEATVWAINARFRYEIGSRVESNGAVVETTIHRQFIALPWNHVGSDFTPIAQRFCCPNVNLHRWVRIVLTCAHLNHDPADNADSNLKALCQWCHLNYDKLHHKETRSMRKDKGRPLLEVAS